MFKYYVIKGHYQDKNTDYPVYFPCAPKYHKRIKASVSIVKEFRSLRKAIEFSIAMNMMSGTDVSIKVAEEIKQVVHGTTDTFIPNLIGIFLAYKAFWIYAMVVDSYHLVGISALLGLATAAYFLGKALGNEVVFRNRMKTFFRVL